MTRITTDLERLDSLLCDIKARVSRPGQVPYLGMQELGQFMEEVHTALGSCLGFDPQKVHISAWHVELEKNGYRCHPAKYGPLDVIYGYRNIASHPNEEKHSITPDEVKRRLGDVNQLLPDLTRLLTDHTFVDHLFEVQVCSLHQRRAETLRQAIASTGAVKDYLSLVLEYALPFVPEKRRGFLKAPPDKQLPLLITILGSLCSTPVSDVLNGLAVHLLQHASATLHIEPLRRWLISHGTSQELGATPPRLRVIRLTLDRDPRTHGAFLLHHVTVLEPVIPGLAEHLPEFPIEVADIGELYSQVVKVLNGIRAVMDRTMESAAGMCNIRNWQEFVLELEVTADLAGMDFEIVAGSRPGRNLLSLFRCITVRPILDPDALLPLRGLDRPLFHPRHDQNAVAVWGTSDPKCLYQAAQGRDCLFTGPVAWGSGACIPPLVEAFEGFPGAIVCPADDDMEGLGPLYEDKDHRLWPELLDRVSVLRRGGARLKVLWNDPSYEHMLAESV